jgi:predicted DNA-binding WGR domain protein
MDSRKLVFKDGSSDKFWNIDLDGSSHTVNFGRTGTMGQTQTKSFDDDDAARKSYDKLIAEKVKKGYTDIDGSTPVAAATETSEPKPKAKAAKAKPTEPKAATVEVEATPVVTKPAGKDASLTVTHEIDLDPQDWFRATFRPRKPLERAKPAPFDKEECLQRLAKLKHTSYGWGTSFSQLKLPNVISKEEAHFWLVATQPQLDKIDNPKEVAKKLSAEKFDGDLSIEDADKLIGKHYYNIEEKTIIALANLFPLSDYVRLMRLSIRPRQSTWQTSHLFHQIFGGFLKYVLPYLKDEQIAEIRESIRASWDPSQQPLSGYDSFPPEYYIAAALGMHDEVYQVTSSWADDRFPESKQLDSYQSPQDIVFGLGSSEAVESEWRRLKLKVRSPEDLRGLLACTGTALLDRVVENIQALMIRDRYEALIKVLALVRSPEIAGPMFEFRISSKAPAIARDWLDANVGNAVAGAIELASGRGKLADEAIDYLKGIKRRGFESVIVEALAKACQTDSAERVQAEVLDLEEKEYVAFDQNTTPEWLATELEALKGLKRKPLPASASPALLPPLVLGDRKLNDDQVSTVLQVLVTTPVTQRHSLLQAIRANVSPQVRDEFAWKLFSNWLGDGSPSKEKWAMAAIGHLGDDASVLRLTPLIRVWPGESQHARAVFGLECLRAIGSSIALMQLSGIAQKMKFKGLKGQAEQFVQDIAKEKGMTRDELEDRVVPDCGLDEQGRREFSFGPRSFSFVLSGELKAMLRDESGKLRDNLPAPSAKDDPEISAASVEEWKLLKKQIKEVATIQAGRLEQAMVTGRRWKVADFESLIVRHPLMTHLARKLIWGGYDSSGNRSKTFRITEERDFADPDDETITLEDVALVGILHPLDMIDAEKARWGEVMSDYEIVPPFPQLGRSVYALEPGEETLDDLKRFHGIKLLAPTMVFTLEKLGWIRGIAMDAGCFDEHSKRFPASDVTAVINYEGNVGMGYIDPDEILETSAVIFCRGMREPSCYGWGDQDKKMKLKDVPAIVISEVIADLQVLKAKVK